MAKNPTIKKPTHKLIDDGICYALVRCGVGKPAICLLSTGETVRSSSFLLDCDLLMGRWAGPVRYLFGADCEHIPETAQMEKVR